VKVQNVGSLGVEDKTDGPSSSLLFFPHLARDVVAVAELVGEALAFSVEEKSTFTTQSWGLLATNSNE
jgi:hypothetical protein